MPSTDHYCRVCYGEFQGCFYPPFVLWYYRDETSFCGSLKMVNFPVKLYVDDHAVGYRPTHKYGFNNLS